MTIVILKRYIKCTRKLRREKEKGKKGVLRETSPFAVDAIPSPNCLLKKWLSSGEGS
jgi:hypothetical protein